MSDTTTAPDVPFSTSAGHLGVHLDESRASDLPFLFEEQQKKKRIGGAVGATLIGHVALLLLAFVITLAPNPAVSPVSAEQSSKEIVWLSPAPGPGGGGGGGGNKSPEPPRKMELPGRDKLAVPVVKKPNLENPKPQDEDKPQELTIPAVKMASGEQTIPGLIDAQNPGLPTSLGTGTGGGAGTGNGTGSGPGTGSGLGPGIGGNTGGGYYKPGNGVELPRVIHEVKPQYTPDAMRAKVQGIVWLECVVMPDGSVGSVEVAKSLDSTFGLDQEAVKAAKQWRFVPGTRFGQPVPVLVTIELTFTLR
jgi:periplasmic protein TonB